MSEKEIEYYRKKLKEKDFKITPQRIKIIQALLELDHPTVKEILKEVHQEFPTVQPLTIYRTLELLEKIGEIVTIDACPSTRYELASNLHAHFICEETKKVKDIINPEIIEKLIMLKNLGPENITKIELNIYGSCSEKK